MSSWPSSTCSRAGAPRPLPPTPRRSPISPPVRPCCRRTRGSAGTSSAFALELHRAECEFLTGALAEAEQRLDALSTRAASTVERATVACLRVDLYTTLGRNARAIAVGLDYLRHLGHRLVAASDRRGSAARIRSDMVATREPADRGTRRSAHDDATRPRSRLWMF